jgi:magnesium chelatase subunit H
VVITLSGIFRDLLPLQIKLLAEAAYWPPAPTSRWRELRAQARAGLPGGARRRHGDRRAARLRQRRGRLRRQRQQLIDNSRWEDEGRTGRDLHAPQGLRLRPRGRPVQQPALLQSVLAGVELAYQNLDSVELGVTTIDTYFDTLGGISRAVRAPRAAARSCRVYIGDQTRGANGGTVRTLSEQVALETAPACSTRSGTKACSSTATKACARSRCT